MTGTRLRPVVDDDRAFLVDLYSSVREPELVHVPWDEATKRGFIEQQFTAQDLHYRHNYPGATLDIVEVEGERAGRLYVHRGPRHPHHGHCDRPGVPRAGNRHVAADVAHRRG